LQGLRAFHGGPAPGVDEQFLRDLRRVRIHAGQCERTAGKAILPLAVFDVATVRSQPDRRFAFGNAPTKRGGYIAGCFAVATVRRCRIAVCCIWKQE
jgi:hypothetical protein